LGNAAISPGLTVPPSILARADEVIEWRRAFLGEVIGTGWSMAVPPVCLIAPLTMSASRIIQIFPKAHIALGFSKSRLPLRTTVAYAGTTVLSSCNTRHHNKLAPVANATGDAYWELQAHLR
jgi:hypothetical protein